MPETNPNLPRIDEPMRGFFPGSIFRQTFLSAPVVDDQCAEIILAEVAGLEGSKARVRLWADRMIARYDEALTVLAESPAVKSLPDYVKKTTGKKTLELPAGTIKVRTQRDILRVHNEAAVKAEVPGATYTYQAPESVKLSREKLKDWLKEHGGKLTTVVAGVPIVAAELIASVETCQLQPSELALSGVPEGGRLLSLAMEEKRDEDANAKRGNGDGAGEVGDGGIRGAAGQDAPTTGEAATEGATA